MFREITVGELLNRRQTESFQPVDVRSPSEFGDAAIPGSVNIPLFDDEERAEIGTLYKQVGVQAAKERGLEIVSAKLPSFVKAFGRIDGEKAVYCWRGGMRSKVTATVLSLMGMQVYRLSGGIRAYRKWVVEQLRDMKVSFGAMVVHGHTGTGKTAILRRLREEGLPVLDLEALSGHRGSIFGHIGLRPHNQKTFESLLVHELIRLRGEKTVLIEAESKRIGKAVLPDFLIRLKEQGEHLLIVLPIEERMRNILDDYRPWEHKEECLTAFARIKSRIHTPIAAEIGTALETGDYERAVLLLLEHYYDPRYEHATRQYDGVPTVIKAQTRDEALEAVRAHYLHVNTHAAEALNSTPLPG